MDPVQKALWFVESHSRESISLEDVAKAIAAEAAAMSEAQARFAARKSSKQEPAE